MAALIPYTILAQGIYTGIIGTISTVTIGTCTAIKSIYTHKNPDVKRIIKKYDVKHKLELIESVLKITDHNNKNRFEKMKLNDLEKTQIFEIIESQNNIGDDPIELCLKYLHESIEDIHTNLKEINAKVMRHTAKWFNSWRTLNIKRQLDDLEENIKILDKRFNDFMRISEFLKNK